LVRRSWPACKRSSNFPDQAQQHHTSAIAYSHLRRKLEQFELRYAVTGANRADAGIGWLTPASGRGVEDGGHYRWRMSGPVDPGELRVGTTERDAAIAAIGEHLVAGRLELDEYDLLTCRNLARSRRGPRRVRGVTIDVGAFDHGSSGWIVLRLQTSEATTVAGMLATTR
jgi:hypothetical protein